MQTLLKTPSSNQRLTGDQARELRFLIAQKAATNNVGRSTVRRCHTVAVSGGKGGVGRSVIATNLAITLAKHGASVGLIDASADLGNVELLCGSNSYWNLSHVARGCRQLNHVEQTGPAGIRILSGGSCLVNRGCESTVIRKNLIEPLQAFESQLDWLIVDASGGTGELIQDFALAADDVLIVTTSEPTAVAEAYASVKSLSQFAKSRLGLLVNLADSAVQAQRILDRLQQVARSFLNIDLHRRGYIPRDPHVPHSVNSRVPFAIQSPTCDAAIALEKLIQRWSRTQSAEINDSFFSRLLTQRLETEGWS